MAQEYRAARIATIILRRSPQEDSCSGRTASIPATDATSDRHFSSTSQSRRAAGKLARKALTAGRVWRMSPIELSRTMRKRSSAIGTLANAGEEVARRVVFGIPDNCHAHPKPCGEFALGNRVGGVVRALGMHVGVERAEQSLDVGLVEDNREIYGRKRGDQLCAALLVEDGPPRAFQPPHAGVGIDADHEQVALGSRRMEIARVPDVKKIEAAICQNDPAAERASFGKASAQTVERKYFVLRRHSRVVRRPLGVLDCGAARKDMGAEAAPVISACRAASSSARVTVAVPRFITTMPAA